LKLANQHREKKKKFVEEMGKPNLAPDAKSPNGQTI
jgi:hypothetical protein